MKIGYSYAKSILLEGNITTLSNYVEDIGDLIYRCFKKEEFDHAQELLELAYKFDFLDNAIKFEDMLKEADEYNTEKVELLYQALIKYAERQKNDNLNTYFLNHAEAALFKFSNGYLARTYLEKVLSNDPNNRDALTDIVYARCDCFDKDKFFLSVCKIDEFEPIKKLIDFGSSYDEQISNVSFIVDACYQALDHHEEIIDYLNVIEILGKIVTFFNNDDTNRFEILYNLANGLRQIRHFDEAIKIYLSLIQYEYKVSQCYWNLLLCKRKVIGNDELVKTGKSFESMEEYRNAVDEAPGCGVDANLYTSILKNTIKRHKKQVASIIGLIICLGIIIGVIAAIIYLYSNGFQNMGIFNVHK